MLGSSRELSAAFLPVPPPVIPAADACHWRQIRFRSTVSRGFARIRFADHDGGDESADSGRQEEGEEEKIG